MVFNSQSAPILLTIGGVFVIWLTGLTVISWRYLARLKQLAEGGLDETINRKLKALEKNLSDLETKVTDHQRAIKWLKNEGVHHFQKAGVIRFNPFEDSGGDQSFAVALLDGNHDGFVFSSLHGRAGNRVYTKLIKKGKPVTHELSKEEAEAVRLAVTKK